MRPRKNVIVAFAAACVAVSLGLACGSGDTSGNDAGASMNDAGPDFDGGPFYGRVFCGFYGPADGAAYMTDIDEAGCLVGHVCVFPGRWCQPGQQCLHISPSLAAPFQCQ